MPSKIPDGELSIIKLNKGVSLDDFDCGNDDLNDFLKNDAFNYEEKSIARTYLCLHQNAPVGFFSICTDAIRLSFDERRDEFGKEKCHSDYPAMKIARLATTQAYKGRGVGTVMVKAVIGKAISLSQEIGCRFVTVDAYPDSIEFYQRLHFVKNLEDKSGENVSLRLDIYEALQTR